MNYKEFKENIINELVKTKLFSKEEAEKYYLEKKHSRGGRKNECSKFGR